jgi:GNAT superfamily N-acetyltransferase
MSALIRYTQLANVDSSNIFFLGLFELYRELAELDYSFFKDKFPISAEDRERMTMEAFANIDKLVLAKEGSRIVGFVSISHDDPESISELFVAETHRRKGIARQLVTKLKEFNPGKLKVNSIMGNRGSLAFYQSMGFVAITIGMAEA